jgi:hypothetical protein
MFRADFLPDEYPGKKPTIILVSQRFQSGLPARIRVGKGPVYGWDVQ